MVELVPMSEANFAAYLERGIREYAEEHARSGNWKPEEALEMSKQSYQRLLPNGVKTENHYLFSIYEDTEQANVGLLWIAIEKHGSRSFVYIYDVMIYKQYRRRGYAEQAFRLLEEKTRELGQSEIRLHVFGHNHAARALYEKLGYVVTNLHMKKDV